MGIRRWLRELTASVEELEVFHAVRDAPPTAIGDLAENTSGCIVGTVVPLDDRYVIAPMTGRRCVAWGVKIEGGGWAKWVRGSVPFILIDRDRRAIIDPQHARTVMTADAFSKCWGRRDANDGQSAMFDHLGVTDPAPGNANLAPHRFAEWAIEAGATLAIVGTGTREPDLLATGDYRERPTLIRITGTPEHPIYMTNEA